MSSREVAAVGRNALSRAQWAEVADSLRLSNREAEIVQLVFDDRCNRSIAAALKISPNTVNTHLSRVYKKLDVRSRVQLVVAVFSRARANGHARPRGPRYGIQ